jgi:predicted DNA-binding protein with PD1-like motif
MGKLTHGADLLNELTSICAEKDIKLGRITAIGAVSRARVGFYNQKKHEYEFISLDQPLEILSLTGNISLRDSKPVIHAHIALSDSTGKSYGGHLVPGTIVFACEWIIEVFDGPAFERAIDRQTGLPLWTLNE